MNRVLAIGVIGLGAAMLGTLGVTRAAAQDPILTPIIVNEVAPIVLKTLTPKPKNVGLAKFEGYIVHANTMQVTVRAKDNELSLQSFPLSDTVAAKMQKIVDQGGYQYGDKVTIYYDPTSRKAEKIKGKPSRPL